MNEHEARILPRRGSVFRYHFASPPPVDYSGNPYEWSPSREFGGERLRDRLTGGEVSIRGPITNVSRISAACIELAEGEGGGGGLLNYTTGCAARPR